MSLDGDFRGKPREEHEHDHAGEHAKAEVRWLLPYADMITLMFALFICLYAIGSVNNAKLEALSASVNKAFNGSKTTPGQTASPKKSPIAQDPGSSLLNSGVTLAELQQAVQGAKERQTEDQRLRKLRKRVRDYAKENGLNGKLSAVIDERGLVIRLISDKVLFNTAEATIRPAAIPVLAGIAKIIRPDPNHVRVEGHTDNVPISTSKFATNWELSSMRATSVLRILLRDRISAGRLSAVGYAYRRPLTSNETEAGRQKNRRVEIVVLRTTGLGDNEREDGPASPAPSAAEETDSGVDTSTSLDPNLGITGR